MRKLLVPALSGLLILWCALTVHAQAAPQPSPTPTRYKGFTDPQYKEVDARSLYVKMHDGVRVAITVCLPQGLAPDARIPALVHLTRYWRAQAGQNVGGVEKFYVTHGYAVVLVDARGTGASFGVWTMPWSPAEIADAGEVVDWIVAQPWSSGRVGAYGNSYSANAALLLAVPNRAAVKAIIARHYEFDEFTDVPFPGGIMNEWLVRTWNEGNRQLDTSPGVRPVDEDTEQKLLQAAQREHTANMDVYKSAQSVTFRDDRGFGGTIDDFSVHAHRREIERAGTVLNTWGGWFDAGTADAVIKTFLTFSNPQRAIIGPWNHGASQNADPYLAPNSPRLFLTQEWLRFFDHYLKGIETDLKPARVLFYYTMGAERWRTTTRWPVAGTTPTRFYLAADKLLAPSAPQAANGADTYQVDFEVTTGEQNRWHTQLGGPVKYPDRAAADERLLTYTTQPLAADMEITGYPVIDLFVTSTHTDGNFFVYLEDVDEQGHVTYLTEGQLRALHRKISKARPPYNSPVPYHSFKRADAQPLVPGATAELRFGLLPTSVLIRRGHRLRVAIAGHDKSAFARVPADGTPTINVARNRRYASAIELPVVRRTQAETAPVNLLLNLPAAK
ncbi:MAG TPA: CocE/NonD family hydrolase [Pyrinomonadaceae bacterium]